MPERKAVSVPAVWTNPVTGQTALKPGAGYWVGVGKRGGRFKVSIAYSETIVGHYAVASEGEASRIHQQLVTPGIRHSDAARA